MKIRNLLALLVTLGAFGCASTTAGPQSESQAHAQKVGAPTIASNKLCTAEALHLVMPQFPASALKKASKGWVVLSFDLNGSGQASNIAVTAEQPSEVFSAVAIEALKGSQFVPGTKRQGCQLLSTYSLSSA